MLYEVITSKKYDVTLVFLFPFSSTLLYPTNLISTVLLVPVYLFQKGIEPIVLFEAPEVVGVVGGIAMLVGIVIGALARITSYNVCYTKLLRMPPAEIRQT